MKTIIEQYIQFAIHNGLDIPPMIEGWYSIENNTLTITSEGEGNIEFQQNITELIMSKAFIESIARGIRNNKEQHKEIFPRSIPNTKDHFYKILGVQVIDWNNPLNKVIDIITNKQSIAIRDEKLEEFIINIGIGKQENN